MFIYICGMANLNRYFSILDILVMKEAFLRLHKPKEVTFDGLKYKVCYDKRGTMKHQRPIGKGVYLIVKRKGKGKRTVLYVGACKSFGIRLSAHDKIPAIRKLLKEGEIIEILCYSAENYKQVERDFIKKYTPLFNKAHNPKNKKPKLLTHKKQ